MNCIKGNRWLCWIDGCWKNRSSPCHIWGRPTRFREIFIKGKRQNIKNPSDAVQNGIGYLSEDRKQFGLLVGMDVKTNIAMASMKDYVKPFGWMHVSKVDQQSEELIKRLK